MNLNELRTYTRDLTGVYATDVATDTLVDRWINEAYFSLSRYTTWPWSATTLVGGISPTSPSFDSQFHQILAYAASIKLLGFVSDDTTRAQFYQKEYDALLAEMLKYYTSAAAPATVGTVAQMTRTVRDITGVFDTQVVPDGLIQLYINHAYNELSQAREWDWLEASEYSALVPSFTGGKHTVNLSSGTRRILEAAIISDNGEVQEMTQVPSLIGVTDLNRPMYDVNYSGVMTFAPEQPDTSTLKVRYIAAAATLGSGDSPAFDARFRMILVYRAAVSVLSQLNPQDPRIQVFNAEYDSIFNSMVSAYELDHDYTTIQMGSGEITARKYLPWFRPA